MDDQKSSNENSEMELFFEAVDLGIKEWDEYFKDHDFNGYLYEDDIDFIYGVMDKFYTRVRTIRRSLPKEIKEVGMKGMPSLRQISNTQEDSDSHLSDWESMILDRWESVKSFKINTFKKVEK